MSVTDPIADLLTRMRNSVQARQEKTVVPASRSKEAILKLLKEAGYIQNYVRHEKKPQDELIVIHKYVGKRHKPVLSTLKRVSKPGRRVYKGYQEIRPLLNGLGIAIYSTPKGILTDVQAKEQKVGGEILCEVW